MMVPAPPYDPRQLLGVAALNLRRFPRLSVTFDGTGLHSPVILK